VLQQKHRMLLSSVMLFMLKWNETLSPTGS
jgi:hypothetical protein